MTVSEQVPSGFLDEDVLRCPFPFYEFMHDKSPVVQVPELGYLVSRYEDVVTVLRDDDTFSSGLIATKMPYGGSLNPYRESVAAVFAACPAPQAPMGALAFVDPPEHTRQRAMVTQVFSPRRIRVMEPVIHEHVRHLVEHWPDSGEVDFVGDFAAPLAIHMICELFGVDPADRANFRRWTDAFIARLGSLLSEEDDLYFARQVAELQAFIGTMIDARRAEPRDDLLSDLVHERVEGQAPLTLEELVGMSMSLLLAGNMTTRSLVASMLCELAGRPEVMARVRADRSLIPNVVEETLRLQAPASMFTRVTTRDVELGGTTIPAGELVVALLHAGNVDARQFEDPLDFRVDRPRPKSHLAFGVGIHFCSGAALSRAEAAIALNILFDTFRVIEIAPGTEPEYAANFQIRTLPKLMLKLER